jgi:hypothetical protein
MSIDCKIGSTSKRWSAPALFNTHGACTHDDPHASVTPEGPQCHSATEPKLTFVCRSAVKPRGPCPLFQIYGSRLCNAVLQPLRGAAQLCMNEG